MVQEYVCTWRVIWLHSIIIHGDGCGGIPTMLTYQLCLPDALMSVHLQRKARQLFPGSMDIFEVD